MSAGAPAKMIANQQMCLTCNDRTTHSFLTLNATMAVVNYSQCDDLIPDKPVSTNIHHKVNLSQTIGGVNLALCDGGANGCMKGINM